MSRLGPGRAHAHATHKHVHVCKSFDWHIHGHACEALVHYLGKLNACRRLTMFTG